MHWVFTILCEYVSKHIHNYVLVTNFEILQIYTIYNAAFKYYYYSSHVVVTPEFNYCYHGNLFITRHHSGEILNTFISNIRIFSSDTDSS